MRRILQTRIKPVFARVITLPAIETSLSKDNKSAAVSLRQI